MIIDCISDLHGHYPELEGGDLLIVAGDLTARDEPHEWVEYFLWQGGQPYEKIIFMSGNHDNRMQNVYMVFYSPDGKVEYLCDSGTEFQYTEPVRNIFDLEDKSLVFRRKLKIWGSPWSLKFKGMNPRCMAFTVDTEEELAEKWALIPNDVDILVTHSPPWSILDKVERGYVGSTTLLDRLQKIQPKLHIFGHIHEHGGQQMIYKRPGVGTENNTICINASYVNEKYKPVNKPMRIEL